MITHILYVHFHVITKSTFQSPSSVIHNTGFRIIFNLLSLSRLPFSSND